MRYIQAFRNAKAAAAVRRRIEELGTALTRTRGPVSIMEVCGTHTMAIARYGIRSMLPPGVELLSGPGCPVCVTEPGYVDAAVELARGGVAIASFGDMVAVPGSERSLADCRSEGATVEICYSPTAAVELAAKRPGREFVFLAIGFETTIAPVVSLVDSARRAGIRNLSLLTAFKLIPPALAALLADPEMKIDAFLCPAHVTAIIGPEAYEPFAQRGGVPCVIAGFEPLDIMLGLQGVLERLLRGEAGVENQYSRVVKPGGNRKAQELMDRHLLRADAAWRGLGVLPASGLRLRPEASDFNAERRHGIRVRPGRSSPGCLCGEVIKGKCRPSECSLFGRTCTPDHPVGPCMVSGEGACAAEYKCAGAEFVPRVAGA